MKRRKIPFFYSPEQLREMYVGQRANRTARNFAKLWARVFGWGLFPRRWVTLEVPGRTSGALTRFPVGLTKHQGRRYLVSMLGPNCNWVRNVDAANGMVVLKHGKRRATKLQLVAVSERAPIIQACVHQIPGARPHIRVSREGTLEQFRDIAPDYPVYEVFDSSL